MAKRNLRTEAPMDFGDLPERPSRSIQQRIETGQTIFSGSPAFARSQGETSYLEKNASERFREVVMNARRFTGIEDLSARTVISTLARQLMSDVQLVTQLETSSEETKKKLIDFAIKIAQKHYHVDNCDYIYDVNFVDLYGIPASQFRLEPEEPTGQQTEPQDDEEETADFENPNFEMPSFEIERTDEDYILEKHKRHLINALVQGAAKKFHWIILDPQVRAVLDSVSPQLFPSYARLMAINDLLYWTEDNMIEAMSSSGSGAGGSSEANNDEEKYPEWESGKQYKERDIVKYNNNDYIVKSKEVTSRVNPEDDDSNWCPKPQIRIKVLATTFIIMIHEIAKGIESSMARWGLPQDTVLAADVMGQTDVMMYEPDQLRFGPGLAHDLRHLLPFEVVDDSDDLKNWFKIVFYRKPAEEFLDLWAAVTDMSNPNAKQRAERKLREWAEEAKRLRYESNYSQEDDDSDEDDDDGYQPPTEPDDDEGFDDLDDLLSGTGIYRPN